MVLKLEFTDLEKGVMVGVLSADLSTTIFAQLLAILNGML